MKKTVDLAWQRAEQEELLDLGYGTDRDVAENLAEMQRINNAFGGTAALTRHLYPRLRAHHGPTSLLDVGTGGGGLPLILAEWAEQACLDLRIIGLDWSARNLHVAAQKSMDLHKRQVTWIQADALTMPVGENSIDFVVSSLFLHHLTPHKVVDLLRQAYHTACCALVMSDLVRGWLPYAAFQLIRPVFARNRLTSHDGALSIRRAYTPTELRSLARQAGLPDPRVYASWPWRMTLVVQK